MDPDKTGPPIDARDESALQPGFSTRLELERTVTDLFHSKELLRNTLASIGDAVVTTESDGTVSFINRAAEAILGWTNEEAFGLPLAPIFHLISEDTRLPINNPVTECLENGRAAHLAAPTLLVRRDGQEVSIDDTASPIFDKTGLLVGSVLVFRDVSENRSLIRELEYKAFHDSLTGLGNRFSFEKVLQDFTAHPQSGTPGALLYLDLDKFKLVNDVGGHRAGDVLLREVGALIQAHLSADDMLARLGGDEFCILLQNCGLVQARHLAERLCAAISSFRFRWQNRLFTVGVSIGLAPALPNVTDSTLLMLAADQACYAAKALGGNRVHVFLIDDEDLIQRNAEIMLVARVSEGLRRDLFSLEYQPIVPIIPKFDDPIWSEVLVRMLGANGQLMNAGDFVQVAERYGLISALDRWVLTESLKALKIQLMLESKTVFSINVSGPSLGDERFLDFVSRELEQSGLSGDSVRFEITETAAITNVSHALRFVSLLQKKGCKFALDDFGTGLSSFAYLKTIRVDYIKIPGRFIQNMIADPMDRAMVEGIQRVSRVMEIRTIAEHVENHATLTLLKDMGIDFVQGMLLGKPSAVIGRAARAV